MSKLIAAAPKLLRALQEIIWQHSEKDEAYEIAETALKEAGLPTGRYGVKEEKEEKVSPTHLDDIEKGRFVIEVYECPCGFHFGVDSTYLEQVGSIDFVCPSCKEVNHIEGDEEDED